jgi:hypothetical protein
MGVSIGISKNTQIRKNQMFKVILAASLILVSATSVLALDERSSGRVQAPSCTETPVKGCTRR